jgi:carbon storage regulator CsrA
MLVLSRRPSQAVLFPASGLRLQVLEIKGNTGKIGVEAPPGVRILRHELSTRPQDLDVSTGPGGVDAWFPKPLDVGKLWEAIQHSLASASARN